jgi:hypothetical protein
LSQVSVQLFFGIGGTTLSEGKRFSKEQDHLPKKSLDMPMAVENVIGLSDVSSSIGG